MNKNELQETHYDIEETIQYIDSCLRSTKHVTEAYKKKKIYNIYKRKGGTGEVPNSYGGNHTAFAPSLPTATLGNPCKLILWGDRSLFLFE